ncbi:hypothetical protein, variant 2 [Aphanomyces astaci]|uniref:RGS domain-containing protein n=1 Tax=Aphanomyces astaci TaxID=112090 RepID=W4FMZ3_APHAT|nr:hypothetical protein, variant 2 [Aphanomyces astaci]ETV68845.1 hypothetical protein, variant 2 [Aphanomyces astaci]|eukprot:XP_009841799.1 hypothetical protein, variant 2 [Aphanomyces astaci]
MNTKDGVYLVLDGLIGTTHDRILYTYMYQQGWEPLYSILAEIHKYTTLPTRTERQTHAEYMVETFLVHPDAVVVAHLHLTDDECFQSVVQSVVDAVADKTCTLDMWSSLDGRLKRALDWSGFFKSDMFGDLCNAIRERHPMTLHDVLGDCDATRIRYLELYLREFHHPGGVSNLLFWVDVQTTFLPLVTTQPASSSSSFSMARFEEIQVTVRRLFNAYLADNPSGGTATAVPDDTKKDVLARILLYQGEPFSPPRYATLFKAAQDHVWRWLASKIMPNFQNSMLYIQWMVEVERVLADRHLHRAYESVASPSSPHKPLKGTLVLPLPYASNRLPSSSKPHPDPPLRPTFANTFTSPLPPSLEHVLTFSIAPQTDGCGAFAASIHDTPVHLEWHASWSREVGPPPIDDVQSYCVDSRQPLVVGAASSTSTHGFLLHDSAAAMDLHGVCVTQWAPLQSDPTGPTVYLPTITAFLARSSLWHLRADLVTAASEVHAQSQADWTADTWQRVVAAVAQPSRLYELTPRFRAFTGMRQWGSEFGGLRRLVAHLHLQNVVAAATALLVGHRVYVIASSRNVLYESTEALVAVLTPLKWPYTYVPYCCSMPPTKTEFHQHSPFCIGVEGSIQIKRSPQDAATHHIRTCIGPSRRDIGLKMYVGSSLCNLTRVHAVVRDVRGVCSADAVARAVLVDLDHDEVYVPIKQELPEPPRRIVMLMRERGTD